MGVIQLKHLHIMDDNEFINLYDSSQIDQSHIFMTNRSHYLITLHNQSPETYIRSRNFSLSLPKQTNWCSPNAQKSSYHLINGGMAPPNYHSKQKHLLLRYSKLKKNRDPAKITQENVQKYMSLKKQVTTLKKARESGFSRPLQQKSFHKEKKTKCSVKLLTIPMNCPILIKKHMLLSERSERMKSQSKQKDGVTSQLTKYYHKEKRNNQNRIKRYNQLTFSQIVENNQQHPHNEHLLNKIHELRSKIERNLWLQPQYIREQPIQGW